VENGWSKIYNLYFVLIRVEVKVKYIYFFQITLSFLKILDWTKSPLLSNYPKNILQ
jgi:hypothetical protein